MILEIKKIDEDRFVAKFATEEIEISEKSEKWNTDGINKFLIKLASKTPTNEEITLNFNKDEKNKIYMHIVELFNTFVTEFNLLNTKK